jgi:hypothetical protein
VKRILLLVLLLSLFLPGTGHSALLPDGTVRWTVSTSEYDVTLLVIAGSSPALGGEMIVTRRSTGEQLTSLLNGGIVNDVNDSFFAELFFLPNPQQYWDFLHKAPPPVGSSIYPGVVVSLVDTDGVAFDGVTNGRPPADPPPLALFETATLSLSSYFCTTLCQGTSIDQQITALPEPAVAGMLLGPLALLARRKRPTDR